LRRNRFAEFAAKAGFLLLLATVGALAGVYVPAYASVNGHVYYTPKGATATAGYEASALGVYFTHQYSYAGSDGPTLEQLSPATVSGGTITSITNGAGIGLCDQNTGDDADLGVINIGGGLKDVVWATGVFTAPAKDGNDLCHNGLPVSSIPSSQILIANVPIGDTIVLNELSDQHHAHNGCAAGTILFEAQDLSNPAIIHDSPCVSAPGGSSTVFNEADQGTVADDQTVAPLASQTVPQPGGVAGSLAVFAHDTLSANTPTGTVHGSFQSIPNWTVFAVASTSNGMAVPGGTLLLAPGPFSEDHSTVFVGGAVG
jgi:hypothetical protein